MLRGGNMSDARLKENVTPIEDPLEVLDRKRCKSCTGHKIYIACMPGCTFTWNNHAENLHQHRCGATSIGCLAQDIESAGGGAEHCVTRDPQTGLLAVDYPKLVPILIEGIRDLKRRLEATRLEVKMIKEYMNNC